MATSSITKNFVRQVHFCIFSFNMWEKITLLIMNI